MSKPHIHAESSARKFGGKMEDYIEIHSFMDLSKGAIADNRHRTLTHTSWFLSNILERIHFVNSCPMTADGKFPLIKNSVGNLVSVRDIGEQHILEDFGGKFIPTPQDYLQEMEYKPWMQNGHGVPSSFQIFEKKTKKTVLTSQDSIDKFRRNVPTPLPEPMNDPKSVMVD